MELVIGKRVIPLALTVYEIPAIQEEIGCTIGQLQDEVYGVTYDLETGEYKCRILEDKGSLRKFGKLIRIMGNAGLEEAGQKPDLTDKWILRNIRPGMIYIYVMLVTEAVNEAMGMEFTAPENGPVDEVLAEENRKKEPGSLLTGESAPAALSPD